ncbi:Acyl dehydratase [Acinetobacter marinus]|uniref:Acyl dehydratase n=1 Tax=Acinetobacter marinus TaxID=281375 RepID=A0A1G6N2Y2_9GAMM|nr:MaoC family dehydratase [Acinetobacter marinus]SDC61777.1 Acyl dehydratase [Acinetobacter marinus]
MEKLYLEDLAVGQTYRSSEYTLTEDNIKQFASAYDPQPFHLDDQAASAHPVFQGLAGSGWQTAAITMRLWVESFPVAGGLVGFGADVQWKRPTRPNDVLHVQSEITDLRRSQSKPNQGIITLFSQTINQNNEVVQESTTKILVWSKDSGVL